MNIINIDNIEYITSDFLFEKAPIYCKDARNGRELIKKKEITEFIFIKLDGDKWIIADGKSKKCDKLYFNKTFVYTIPEVNEEKVIISNGVESAPDIINLENNEKFKDENNNVIEIETRGERSVDGIYFKVKDVMVGFGMESLNKVIINTLYNGYIINIHYKYFNCKKIAKKISNKKIKKELFLTYQGFTRVAYLSHNKCMSNNLYTIKKWLDIFDKSILSNYMINIKDNITQNNIGFVYIVSSNLLDAVKIGMWRSTIKSLYSRYTTCYGNNIHIDYFLTSNARELENKTHIYFNKDRITNELFDKNKYNKYIKFIQSNAVEPLKIVIDDESNTDTDICSDITTETEKYDTYYNNMSIETNNINMQIKILSLEKELLLYKNN